MPSTTRYASSPDRRGDETVNFSEVTEAGGNSIDAGVAGGCGHREGRSGSHTSLEKLTSTCLARLHSWAPRGFDAAGDEIRLLA